MDWIKRNYDQAALLLFALALLVISGLLVRNAMAFPQTFEGIQGDVRRGDKLAPVEMSSIESAMAALEKPPQWVVSQEAGSMFVPEPYVVKDGQPIPVEGGMFHPPVPNEWLRKFGLNILSINVLNEDPDGDGFSNLEEWKNTKGDGSDATDPTNERQHPPAWNKLRLAKYIAVPFRLRFDAYDGDPSKPATLTFQINTIDVKQPTQFVKLNQQIAGTSFKPVRFEKKMAINPAIQAEQDMSELVVKHVQTGAEIEMTLGKQVNSPDSYAQLRSLVDNKEQTVKKGQAFSLASDPNAQYKLIDIQEGEALIQTPADEKIRVTSEAATLVAQQ